MPVPPVLALPPIAWKPRKTGLTGTPVDLNGTDTEAVDTNYCEQNFHPHGIDRWYHVPLSGLRAAWHSDFRRRSRPRTLVATEVTSPASSLRSVTTANAEMPWAPMLNFSASGSLRPKSFNCNGRRPTTPDDDAADPAVPPGMAQAPSPSATAEVEGYMVESSPDGTNWSNLVQGRPQRRTESTYGTAPS